MAKITDYQSILITGGTGSFGKRFVRRILQEYPHFERVVVFSRDEFKQYQMAQMFSPKQYPQLKYVLGDVRDADKLKSAFADIDVVIHAAALKQVDTSESNPLEFIKTNILGAENVIRAAVENQVKKIIALSSDKAVNPVSLYGATKMCADKLFLVATQSQNRVRSRFCVVRYGNVVGARGSVIPLFLQKKNEQKLPITHPDMTRFSVPVGVETDLVLYALEHSAGGEVFVPKTPSYRITDVAQAICPQCTYDIIGVRPGEKLHEELFTSIEAQNAFDTGNFFILYPPDYQMISNEFQKVNPQFAYASNTNTEWLSIQNIQEQMQAYWVAEGKDFME
ncbi:MAG: UDP-N-acetylglucosamine 4,6-dehydratase (inverting) [Microscillaceae bacterium]|jgi:UDP-N-acetylglucosamine 4,6-dehydratase (inverting)|nr:UDP-N-acetylglucosamine 4,6-dehydratase (inverting) [Microscillaceae bacterium]